MSNIKDVIHLYIGCEVKVLKSSYYLRHNCIASNGTIAILDVPLLYKLLKVWDKIEVKLILRRLSNMTKKENRELAEIIGQEYDHETWLWTPDQIVWLLKNGFDLFDLIKTGQAIDKKKISKWATQQK